MKNFYGEAPVALQTLELPEWKEFMHYLYLPVRIPDYDRTDKGKHALFYPTEITLPERLGFLTKVCEEAIDDAWSLNGDPDPYVYVTARRGFATPGNPLNRPGWHCDDFGGSDLNYIWSDAYPTRFLVSDKPLNVSEDDKQSMVDMEHYAYGAMSGEDGPGVYIYTPPEKSLLRLTPHVIHDTPQIPAPGGMRSFFKISVSSHRYDLVGNSHNYELNYDWPMVDREALRNQPSKFSNKDYSGGSVVNLG